MLLQHLAFVFCLSAYKVDARPAGPIVHLTYGSFRGNSTGNIVQFLGIPFAAPPLGQLRFAPPQPPIPFVGIRNATAFGTGCFQQHGDLPSVLQGVPLPIDPPSAGVSEDCLFINIVRPAKLPFGKAVPVVMWFFGGGFQVGDTSHNPGDTVVERSISLKEPIIYVSSNYRLSALGFLGGKEVKAAGIGNAGLRDQRFAMEWVQQHIASFGGDPKKVTIWGESAGAVAVGLHQLINNGHQGSLFRSAILDSGAPMLLHPITDNQPHFDQLVLNTGCTGAQDHLACLRGVPFANLSAAINLSPSVFSYSALQLTWQPTIDGSLITRDPQLSILNGMYAKIPIMTGSCDDEATIFSLSTLNITDNEAFLAYMETNYGFPASLSGAISQAYPDDITQGSPFDTGTDNAITTQYKRIAAIQGDLAFQAPRRFLLENMSKTQTIFAFHYKRDKTIPVIGTYHGADIPEFYGTGDSPDFIGTDALINFVNTGDPNLPKNPTSLLSEIDWKPWNSSSTAPPLLTFLEPAPTVTITSDTFRADAISLLINVSLAAAGIAN